MTIHREHRASAPEAADEARTGLLVVALVTVLIAVSLLATSVAATATPLPLPWYTANVVLHGLALTWLLLSHRYRSRGTPLLLSATFMSVVVVVSYSALAVCLAFGGRRGDLVLRIPSPSSYAYVTWAGVLVLFGAVLVILARELSGARRAGSGPQGSGRRAPTSPELADRLWWFGLGLAGAAIACFVLFALVQGRSPLGYGIFLGDELAPRGTEALEVLPQFLLAGIDLGIPATLFLACGTRRRLGRRAVFAASLVANLMLFADLGFKYRVVVLFLALAIVFENRPERSRTHGTARARPPAVRGPRRLLVTAVLATAVIAFFVVQIRRGDQENLRETTSASFADAEYDDIVTRSLDIVTPYAAYEEASLPVLRGRSYVELPLLAVPRVLNPAKALPATVTELQRVVKPGTGAVFPLWAEADANAGLPGLVLFGAGLGAVVVAVDRLRNTQVDLLIVRALATAVLPSVLSRPLMFWAVQQAVFVVGPALLFVWRTNRSGRSRAAGRRGVTRGSAHALARDRRHPP